MTEQLVKSVAEAMAAKSNDVGLGGPTSWGVMYDTWQNIARAAIAAIEASGTHVVVPVEANEIMINAGAKGSGEDSIGVAIGAYNAMLAARPKVLP